MLVPKTDVSRLTLCVLFCAHMPVPRVQMRSDCFWWKPLYFIYRFVLTIASYTLVDFPDVQVGVCRVRTAMSKCEWSWSVNWRCVVGDMIANRWVDPSQSSRERPVRS